MSSTDGAYPDRGPSLTPTPRIGDAEREQAATALSEHFAAGRIDRAEFDVRLDAAYAARTGAELEPLFADLPGRTPLPAAVPADRTGTRRRSLRRPLLVVPALLPVLLLVGFVMVVSGGHFPFFIFPLLWFMGAFGRGRRSW